MYESERIEDAGKEGQRGQSQVRTGVEKAVQTSGQMQSVRT